MMNALVGGEVVCEYYLEDFEKETRSNIYGYDLNNYFNSCGGLDDIE